MDTDKDTNIIFDQNDQKGLRNEYKKSEVRR